MSESAEVWIVDDDRSIRWVLERALTREGLRAVGFDSADGVLRRLAVAPPDVLISDIRMPGMDGLELLSAIEQRHSQLPVIIMTAYSDLESAVAAYQGGAFDYLPKPFDVDEAVDLVRRALARASSAAKLADKQEGDAPPEPPAGSRDLVGSAPAMQDVFRAIGRLSRSHITVLITGESGTGKELVARALHRHSPRADGQFIAINTAAIPRELLESELFGHERGAFTGAQNQRRGRFEQADGGTLFLDEIGDMPAELQTRLLRVLANGEFYRVGGHLPVKVDVRIIAATHQDLERRVVEGVFREDLMHRLNVIRIHLPPLRERRGDVPLLLEHFLFSAARELAVEVKRLQPEVVAHLSRMDWPGNVRQLENACRWLTVMASASEIRLADLPPELRSASGRAPDSAGWEVELENWATDCLERGERGILQAALPRFEQAMLSVALRYTGGRRQDAARLLGWGRNTLTRKLKRHEVQETD